MLSRVCLLNRAITTQLRNDPQKCLEHIVFNLDSGHELDWGWIQFEGPLPGADPSQEWLGISWDKTNKQRRSNRKDGILENETRVFHSVTDDVSFVKNFLVPTWAKNGCSFVEAVAVRYLLRSDTPTDLKRVSKAFLHVLEEGDQSRQSVPTVSALWDIPPGQKINPEFRLVGFEDHENKFLTADKILRIPSLSLPNLMVSCALPESQKETSLSVQNAQRINEFISLFRAPACSVFSNLQALDLTRNKHLTNISELFSIIRLCPKLETLVLNGNSQLFQHPLERLEADGNCTENIDRWNFKAIPKTACPNLKHIMLSQVFDIDLPVNAIALSRLARLIQFLAASLETLYLSDNSLSLEDTRTLLAALHACGTLKEIDLSHNQISGLADIASLLPPSVAALSLATNPLRWQVESLPSSNYRLSRLNVDECGINDWTTYYWLCLYVPALTDLRVAKNSFLANSGRETAHWSRDRYKRWACLERLRTSDGEALTEASKVEADRYVASLLTRGLDFTALVQEETPSAESCLLRILMAKLFGRLERNFEEALRLAREAFTQTADVASALKAWLPMLQVPDGFDPSQSLRDAMKARPAMAQFSVLVSAGETRHALMLSLAPTFTTVEDLKMTVAARLDQWDLMERAALWDPEPDRQDSKDQAHCTCPLKHMQLSRLVALEPDFNTLDFFGLEGGSGKCYNVLLSETPRQAYDSACLYAAVLNEQ
eukprot:Gregarina_sp_Poly_1__11282@NODE_937_length_5654_cov_79_487918_g663_i0_p1_GENE_NODE_937_length_5654_cov_79_487918_g663_i0NODE_937_length_5654_cov_79_487918_g663_i0_p1_ORF_typecomplete_len718_score109_14LRR_9/PF14580_6/0_0096LRR_9/PF14580_6/1LRR_9/PF14580_6/1_7e05LRR_9/PF14580_6/1_4e08LRR_9/PF14580_6/1_5e03LRR_8/PF13855_6/0_0068LRR_8/PF13855_6/1_8LRR_8/PF13855_6/1_6e05LRR_4/PF12799_7/1_3e03LRR_4/PF12799_7/0_0019LRR_4/PF12799_7/1_3e02LRR_4/PF12799_7/0_0033LRR_1/PF00560_33/1_6e02LRR_1/PF00560_33/1_3